MEEDLVALEEEFKKDEEKLSNLQVQVPSLHKRLKDLDRNIRHTKILDWFVPAFFAVAIVLGLLGISFYPRGTPETKAVVSLTGSALLLGGAGLLLSYQSIRYSNFYARWSIVMFEFQKVEDEMKRLGQRVEYWKKSLSEYQKGQSRSREKP